MVCPVLCPPALFAGSILSRYFGLSDVIIGLWFGALTAAIFLIIIEWLDRKKIKFLFRKPLLFFGLFFINYYPLYQLNFLVYQPFIFFLDKFLFGSLLGVVVFFFSEYLNVCLIRKKGKSLFKFQKVILPVLILFIVSIILQIFSLYLKF